MSTNNARRETIAKSWTFAPAWRAGQRCLVPVESWVEPYWGLGSRNVWWSFRRADGEPAALAGLYSEWVEPATGEVVPNYTMITQPADGHPGRCADQAAAVGSAAERGREAGGGEPVVC